MTETCCRNCRGSTPHMFCAKKSCICHIIRNHIIDGGLPYADPTSRKALRNVSRKQSRRDRRQK